MNRPNLMLLINFKSPTLWSDEDMQYAALVVRRSSPPTPMQCICFVLTHSSGSDRSECRRFPAFNYCSVVLLAISGLLDEDTRFMSGIHVHVLGSFKSCRSMLRWVALLHACPDCCNAPERLSESPQLEKRQQRPAHPNFSTRSLLNVTELQFHPCNFLQKGCGPTGGERLAYASPRCDATPPHGAMYLLVPGPCEGLLAFQALRSEIPCVLFNNRVDRIVDQ